MVFVVLAMIAAACGGDGADGTTAEVADTTSADTVSSTTLDETTETTGTEEEPGTTSTSEVAAGPNCGGEVVQVGQSSFTFIYLPLYVALGSGAFDRVGLEAEFTELGGAATVTQALAAGDIDISVENAGSIIGAAAQGGPVKVVAPLMSRNGLYVVAKADLVEEAGLDVETATFEEKVSFLAGKNIAIASPGGGTDQLARFLLRAGGLDPDVDAALVGHEGSAAMVSSFVADRVDAVITSAPSVYTAIDEGNGVYLWNLPRGDLELTNNMLYTGVGVNTDTLESNPELIECVLTAFQDAYTLMQTDEAAAKDAAREFFADLDQELFDIAYDDHAAAAPESPVITQDAFDTTMELLNAARPEPLDIAFDAAIDTSIASDIASS